MAFDSFGNGGGKAWQTPAPAEKPESAAAAGHSLAPTMRVGGGPTDGCSSRPDLCRRRFSWFRPEAPDASRKRDRERMRALRWRAVAAIVRKILEKHESPQL